jgi:hypothetical protein
VANTSLEAALRACGGSGEQAAAAAVRAAAFDGATAEALDEAARRIDALPSLDSTPPPPLTDDARQHRALLALHLLARLDRAHTAWSALRSHRSASLHSLQYLISINIALPPIR